MFSLCVENVNQALASGLRYLELYGERETSRNGLVLVAPTPVTTTYLHPTHRVLFSPMRDANPFFHLMESLWMLAGRNDLAFPLQFNKNFASYSDDQITVHGAYGHRWRKWFHHDQLDDIAAELISNPNSRRAVLAMWSASPNHAWSPWRGMSDSAVAIAGGKDVPCNTQAYFDARGGKLNMTVCCRSNDIYWGAYGANAVHFSFLLELMAAWIGIPVGVYRQMSNNYHAYTDIVPVDKFETLAVDAVENDMYALRQVDDPTLDAYFIPLVTLSVGNFFQELDRFFKDPANVHGYQYNERFIGEVAVPMYRGWTARRMGQTGLESTYMIQAWDWRMACVDWINRREAKKAGAR